MSEIAKIYDTLTEIFYDVCRIDKVKMTPELCATDVPGWNSFTHMEIVVAVEERFGIRLNNDEMDFFNTIGNLAKIIEKKK